MGRAAVFLDRDGVLTIPHFRDGRSYAPTQIQDFRLYPGASAATARLKNAGFTVIVATNQPDITTGKLDPETLGEMHDRLRAETTIDDIEVSTATRANPDRRRKPEPGMLLDAAAKWDIDLSTSYMVGDRASDIICGVRAGCRTVFIELGYTSEAPPTEQNTTATNLGEAVDWICADYGRQGGTK